MTTPINLTMLLRIVWAIVLTIFLGSHSLAAAQGNCKAIPAGPDRTDCYIVQSRVNRQKSELAATIARQQADEATYQRITGKHPKKARRAAPAAQEHNN